VQISRAVVADMLSHARQEAPRECCGLLIGRGDVVNRSVRTTNRDEQPTRYLIDVAEHFAAIHTARSEGQDVIGAYHSHPSGGAVPSPTDLSEANSGSEFLYVIVALAGEDVRAYRIEAGVFTACPLTLTP
jgi:proteasome lid subunit RPN8/RPN11